MLKGKHMNTPQLNKILGYKFETAISIEDYRKKRLEKLTE